MTKYVKSSDVTDCIERLSEGLTWLDVRVDDAIEAVNAIPPANVRELVRGYWTVMPDNMVWNADGIYRAAYQCSNCGAVSPFEGDYCFRCGAEMSARLPVNLGSGGGADREDLARKLGWLPSQIRFEYGGK